MRLNRPEFLRLLRSWSPALLLLGPVAMVAGCGGGDKAKLTGTQAPPVQDDYGKTMEEFMKTHPPQSQGSPR